MYSCKSFYISFSNGVAIVQIVIYKIDAFAMLLPLHSCIPLGFPYPEHAKPFSVTAKPNISVLDCMEGVHNTP